MKEQQIKRFIETGETELIYKKILKKRYYLSINKHF